MNTKRVLYAEDELSNRKLIQIRLKDEGVACDVAQNCQKALKLYHEQAYDMVILDHYMPRMNGDKVAKVIRSENPSIPVIAITSDNESSAYLRICGFNDVIVKPLSGHASIARILNYLRDDL